MTHFFAPERPVSGVALGREECTSPTYHVSVNDLEKLTSESRSLLKQFGKVVEAMKNEVDVKKVIELAERGSILQATSKEMSLRLQIASKLTTECLHLSETIERNEVTYEERRKLKKRLRWIVSRAENAIDAGLAACEQGTDQLDAMKQVQAKETPLSVGGRGSSVSRWSGKFGMPGGASLGSGFSPRNVPSSRAVERLALPSTAQSQKSVSFKAKTVGYRQSRDEGEGDDDDDDQVEGYWKEAHHRYRFHRNTMAMIRQDPNSLHNLGIAVCDSFVPLVDEAGQGLPPAPDAFAKMPDFADFERRALETLDGRVFKIYDKISDAALLACSSEGDRVVNTPSQTSFISIDHELLGNYSQGGLSSAGGVTGTERTGHSAGSSLYRQSTPFSVRIERLHAKLLKLGKPTADATPTVAPRDLPALPLPLMKSDQVYPKDPSAWLSDKNIGRRHPQPKVVNQHKLFDETKLRLFRSKTRAFIAKSSRVFRKPTFDGDEMAAWTLLPWAAPLKLADNEQKQNRLQDVITWLDHSSADQQNFAIQTLEGLHVEHPSLVEKLCEKLSSEHCKVYAAKALISYGVWTPRVLDITCDLLTSSMVDDVTKASLILEMTKTSLWNENYQLDLPELSAVKEVLQRLMRNGHETLDESSVYFESALLLGILGSGEQKHLAVRELRKFVEDSTNTWIKARALEVIIRFAGSTDVVELHSLYDQIGNSSSWECRGHSLCLLMCWNPDDVIASCDVTAHGERVDKGAEQESLYQVIRRALWDETSKKVRSLAADVSTVLNLRARAVQEAIRDLESSDDAIRLQAVISIGTLGVRRNSTVKLLIEMLEIDQSDYIKVHIMRTLESLMVSNARILRLLASKESQGGPMGREAAKCYRALTTAAG